MYVELDGDEVAIAYIKDVTFNVNRPETEVVKMTKVCMGQQKKVLHPQPEED